MWESTKLRRLASMVQPTASYGEGTDDWIAGLCPAGPNCLLKEHYMKLEVAHGRLLAPLVLRRNLIAMVRR